VKEISPGDLKRMREGGEAFQLVDVREAYEAERCTLGGTLIPLGDVLDRMAEIRRDVPVVMHCKSGNRSSAVISALTQRHGFTNLVNLRGGITAYAAEVDTSLQCE